MASQSCCVCEGVMSPGSTKALPCLHSCCKRHLQPADTHLQTAEAPSTNLLANFDSDSDSSDEEQNGALELKDENSSLFCRRCSCDVTVTPGGTTSELTWQRLAAMMYSPLTTLMVGKFAPSGRVLETARAARCAVDGNMATAWCRTCRTAICRQCACEEHELHVKDEGDGERGRGEDNQGELKDADDVDELLKQVGRWLERQPVMMEEMEDMRKFMAKTSVPNDPEVGDKTFEKALTRLLKTLQEDTQDVEAELEDRETRLYTFKEEAGAALAAIKRTLSTARRGGQPLVSALLTPTLRAVLARGCQTDVRVGAQRPLPSLGVSLQVIWHAKVKVTAVPQLDIRGLGVDPGSADVIVGEAASKRLLRYSCDGELKSSHAIGCAPCSLAVGEEAVAVVADGKLLLYDVHDLNKKKTEVPIPGGIIGNSVPAPTTVAALGGSRFLVGNLPSNNMAIFDSSGILLEKPDCPLRKPVMSLFEVSDDLWLLSSWGDSLVVLMSTDGDKVQSFQQEVRGYNFHWQPNYSVALESGHVVVANYYSHEVLVFDPKGDLVFRDRVQGLNHPRNLAYCSSLRRLVATNPIGDIVAFSIFV